MTIRGFIWDDLNIQHILRHEVAPNEVDEVLLHQAVITKERWGRFAIYGTTKAKRYLVVVIEPRDNDMYYPVTAYAMNTKLKAFYKKELYGE